MLIARADQAWQNRPAVGLKHTDRRFVNEARALNRRSDRGGQTRAHIVEAASRLFTEHGYDTVSVGSILAVTGLSKGALYHHFAGKQAIFAAVLELAEQRIATRLREAASGAVSPHVALRQGAEAWLRLAAVDATVRRIVLLDAPLAVGWHAWRAASDRHTLGLIRGALEAAAKAGQLDADRVDLAAHMLMAMLIEAALVVATTEQHNSVVERATATVFSAIDGLLRRD